MLTNKEKEEFSEKLKKLKSEQEKLRKSLDKDKPEPEDAEKFKPLGFVYEFISMILLVSLAGYYLGKFTNSLPWTMIIVILLGFIYAFVRLYKSVSR